MVLKQLFIAGSLSFTLALQGWGQVPAEHDTVQANYELAEKFHEFTLGGKLSNNSMSLYPHEINDTDNFWFDFTTSAGKHYYYVNPKEGKKELLFDNEEMAMLLSGLTHEVESGKVGFVRIKVRKRSKVICIQLQVEKV